MSAPMTRNLKSRAAPTPLRPCAAPASGRIDKVRNHDPERIRDLDGRGVVCRNPVR